MCKANDIKGVSLTELMVALVIISLTLSVGVPAFKNFTDRVDAQNDISALRLILYQARSTSILQGIRTRLCPLDDADHCTARWNDELTLFLDINNNKSLDAGETVINQIGPSVDNTVIRSFTGSSISFDERGIAGISTGSFGYCHKAADPISTSFIISRLGRIRPGKDTDKNGVKETAAGKDIECPD